MYKVIMGRTGLYGIRHIGSGKEVKDVSPALLAAERLAKQMTEEKVDPLHMDDVINDYIEDETSRNIATVNKVLNALAGMCEKEGYTIEETGIGSAGRSAVWYIDGNDFSIMVSADVYRKVAGKAV